jgi:hypothetical protein
VPMTSAAYSSQSAREKGAGDVQYWLPMAAMPPTSERIAPGDVPGSWRQQ